MIQYYCQSIIMRRMCMKPSTVSNPSVKSLKPSAVKPWLKHYTEKVAEGSAPKCTLYEYLYRTNKDNLDDIALNYLDNTVSYSALFKNIVKTAQSYLALGVKAGDIVLICSITTPEIVYSFYALNLIGATPNMVDPRTSAEGIRNYIEETGSKIVCVLNLAYGKIKEAVAGLEVSRIIVVSPSDSLVGTKKVLFNIVKRDTNVYLPNTIKWNDFLSQGEETELKKAAYSEKHCGAIVHTGGTTGSPKGVMLSDDNFNKLAFQLSKSTIKFIRQQKFLNVMPPFIAYGFSCGIHFPLSVGMTSVIIPNLNPNELGSLILKYKPSHMCGVPTHFETLIKDKKMRKADISYLINSGSGGDAINIGAENEVNEFLLSHGSKYLLAKGYGMTELCSAACTCMGKVNKLGSVGIPLILNTISAFEPDTDNELDFGEKGEICITGPTIMLGYYDNPKETANILRKHSDGKIWAHTGDIGYVDSDGFVFIDSRIKRMIVRHDGFKVFPSMIENVISLHPAVSVCSIVAKSDKEHTQGNLPFAYVVLKNDVKHNEQQVRAEIIALCKEKLPEYAQPVDYNFRESLYYTPIGKVDYLKLELECV